jgi:hypothetical protein
MENNMSIINERSPLPIAPPGWNEQEEPKKFIHDYYKEEEPLGQRFERLLEQLKHASAVYEQARIASGKAKQEVLDSSKKWSEVKETYVQFCKSKAGISDNEY